MVLLMSLGACGTSEKVGENPFFVQWDTPYGVPPFDRIEPAHFLPAFERAMSLNNAQIDAIVSNNDESTFENVILAFDEAGRELEQVSSVFGMLCAAETNPEMQCLEEQIMPRLSAHDDRILMNERLFARIREVYDRRGEFRLSAEQMRLLEKTYERFVRSGAELDAKDKERLQQINSELSLLSVRFGNNILAENNAFRLELGEDDLEGLPSTVREQAQHTARELKLGNNKWVFTLHRPSLFAFLSNSSRRDLREQIYKAYLNRCSNGNEYDNGKLVNDFVRLRCEKAHLLGYTSYAAYVTAGEMASTPAAAYELLDEIWTPALESARKELAEMEPLFRKDHPEEKFESWDWWYYAEKVRKQKYALDEDMVRPYLTLGNVQEGIFFLANRLYGITFRPIGVPVYHTDVTAYEVLDADESHLGVLYFDFFVRPGKSQGAWCGNYVEQSYADGKRVAPVVSIVTNFTRPAPGTLVQLDIDQTQTLFHEFGHALHFLFHDVKYRGLSEVEGDFVELPSQVMENWAFEPEMLRHYAIHFRTNEPMPQFLIDKLRNSRLFNRGFMTTELIAASLTDLDIHSITDYSDFDPADFEHNALRERRELIPQIEPRYRYPYFAHIFAGGYSSGYYFYTWAEVLDKDAFEAFRESGDLFDRRVADRFRRRILERGGSEDGMSLYRAFRGRNPDRKPMLKAAGLWTEPGEEESVAADSVRVNAPVGGDARTEAPAAGDSRRVADPIGL